ncbi:MAG: c-type cytochrome [Gammaproteobacteria bacterium]
MRSTIKWFVVFMAAFIGLSASAAGDEYAAIRDKLQACATCHGDKGASAQAQYPILAGQELHYLYVQLKDFKAERRADPIMSPIAATLEKEEMQLMAKYFSEQAWPNIGHRSDAALEKVGLMAASAGQCVACHLGGYEGNSRVPRLAGQHPEYLQKTMLDFKTKTRKNSPAKGSLMESFGEEDIEGMADYLGGL